MKKALLILGVAVALAFSGCSVFYGSDGEITGQYSYSSNVYAFTVFSLGGFPSGTLSQNSSYTISPGTYTTKYAVYTNGGYYWPGNSSGTGSLYDYSPYWCWKSTYTVTANEGTLFQNGADKSFKLYLNYSYGLQVYSGDATVSTAEVHVSNIAAPAASANIKDLAPNSSSWTSEDGSVTVTVTNTLEKMTAEEVAQLRALQTTK